jgi:hypothetical protein
MWMGSDAAQRATPTLALRAETGQRLEEDRRIPIASEALYQYICCNIIENSAMEHFE